MLARGETARHRCCPAHAPELRFRIVLSNTADGVVADVLADRAAERLTVRRLSLVGQPPLKAATIATTVYPAARFRPGAYARYH
jgi:hypothetical protein